MNALSALLSLQSLELLPRSGWCQRGVPDAESIADHALGTCFVVLALAPRVEPPLDVGRAVSLALVHDAPEALTGDIPRTGAQHFPDGAKRTAEDAAARELLEPLSDHAAECFIEYRAGATREARLVRLCDKLQLGVKLLAYVRRGQRGLEELREVVESLDCNEFEVAQEFREELLTALEETDT